MAIDQAYLDALTAERDGYVRTGRVDRVNAVDDEITRVKRALGVTDRREPPKDPTPQQRHTKRA